VSATQEEQGGGPVETVVPRMRTGQLLRVRAVWLVPLAVASVLVFLMTLFYVGSVVNPVGHLSGLPVVLVDQDQGATVLGRHVDLGAQVASGLLHTPAVSGRLSLDTGSLDQAEQIMNRDGAYATIDIPADFTSTLLAAYDLDVDTSASTGKPTVRILTNPRSGSIGVELATGVAEPALHTVSAELGRQLSKEAVTYGRTPSTGVDTRDPLTVASTTFNPLPPDSALGLSAFYVSLLSIMCGFLGAILVHTTVDGALGYGVTEIGPRWSQRMPVSISRWHTLLSKWAVAAVVTPVLTGILLLVAVGLLNMDAPEVGLLWVFTSFAGIAIALGTLALLAALGALGQMVAMLLFIYLALASSGGTIPLQALPTTLRFAANFEPLRQVLDGVRAILYFGGAGDAGLTRGFVMAAIGLVLWLVVGYAVTTWYDRRGLDRLQPELLEFMHQSASAYAAEQVDPPADGPDPDQAD
jgi:YhgE/Pip-like protein